MVVSFLSIRSQVNQDPNRRNIGRGSPASSDMPRWYYDKPELKQTPSATDGFSFETEFRYRREAARFIIKVGLGLNLRYDTIATGVVFMHRFYMRQSFKNFPRLVTACSCLFLAGKVEETPKKCKDIVKFAESEMTAEQKAKFGKDPRETIMIMERILLQTLNFDLQIDHPYQHLLNYTKTLRGEANQEQCGEMVQRAWTFINDSLCTMICLQWEPEIVAIAVMFLAGKLSKFDFDANRRDRSTHWWDQFAENVSIELIEDICHQILDLYQLPASETSQGTSPPQSPSVGAAGDVATNNHVNLIGGPNSTGNANYAQYRQQQPPPPPPNRPNPASQPGSQIPASGNSGSGSFGNLGSYGYSNESWQNSRP